MSGEVSLNCQVGRERMSVTGGNQVAYVLIEARPSSAVAQARMPLNFALVLDHSGSMKGAKLQSVKEAVKLVINHMAPTDIVSVVIFDDNVRVIVPAQAASDKMGLGSAVDSIREGGGTAMSLGMSVGLTELRKHASPATVNRMILLTDGVTYGDPDRCRRIADDAGASGIGIYPLGIGADWDEDLLDNIGQRSSGMPAEFIRRPEDALGLFQRQLQSAEAVSVRNAQLTVRLPSGVTPSTSRATSASISPFREWKSRGENSVSTVMRTLSGARLIGEAPARARQVAQAYCTSARPGENLMRSGNWNS